MTATETLLKFIRKNGKSPHMVWAITDKYVKFPININVAHPTKGINIAVFRIFETKGRLSVDYVRRTDGIIVSEPLPTKDQIHFHKYTDSDKERIAQRNEQFADVILNALVKLNLL